MARAIEAGVRAFMKTRPAVDVVAAIRAAHEANWSYGPTSCPLARPDSRRICGDALTNREIDVLRSLAKGRSTDAIASQLFLSIHTVRNHVRNILMKTGRPLEACRGGNSDSGDGIISLEEIG